ncbi:bacteriocin immunity protein [Aquibacillus saliphilus]|uniref:bacteriocin immunity protein n=1 Tax=Aquibacillus saliphilus TaxID=1909422 RepID=UPI001CF0C5C0|nr:bacteriocin immunity protein [Aquibacillus saliphilus]
MQTKANDREQLKSILTSVYNKGNNGASLQDVMNELKNELTKINRVATVSSK